MNVPEKYADKMFSVPSNEVYMLSKDEVASLEGKTPYYEELLFSNCGSFTKQEDDDNWECPSEKNPSRCSSLSSGYLAYIKSKIRKTERCWMRYDAVERWKRMNAYLKINSANKK